MHNILFFLFSFLFINAIESQQNSLSPEAKISVLTIGPGASLNDAFGHSAFRIKDDIRGTDLVYNYGVYDFNTPNFYLKFAQGKLNYLIGLNYYEDFYESYVSQNRTIKEQVLNLSQEEKQSLFNYLNWNYKPENRAYLYDFFYDNCATRIRDVIQEATPSKIIYNQPKDLKTKTFRQLIHDHLNLNTWGALGIDVALGSVIDRQASPYEYMFLPEYIHTFLENAEFSKAPDRPLVSESRVIFEKIDQPTRTNFFTSPLFILGLIGLLIIYITYSDYKKKKRTLWLDVFIFSLTGIVGVFILLLWFATDHTGTHHNYNLLWAFALNLFTLGEVIKKTPSNWFRKYLKLLVILLCLLT